MAHCISKNVFLLKEEYPHKVCYKSNVCTKDSTVLAHPLPSPPTAYAIITSTRCGMTLPDCIPWYTPADALIKISHGC